MGREVALANGGLVIVDTGRLDIPPIDPPQVNISNLAGFSSLLHSPPPNCSGSSTRFTERDPGLVRPHLTVEVEISHNTVT
ncbi:hypothetical protein M434DRAFT_29438 [Hypoxylon sp. CO27-5]|nr:hypothetical protein M434DRAFT_29438 [Hypoxylon sp. CO27-5]